MPDTLIAPQALTDQDMDRPITLNISGRDQTLPLKDWLAKANKGEAAEENFRKAADLRKEAESAQAELAQLRELKGTFEGLKSKDPRAFASIAQQMGLNMEQAERVWALAHGKDPDDDEDDDTDGISTPSMRGKKNGQVPMKITADMLDDNLKADIALARRLRVQAQEQGVDPTEILKLSRALLEDTSQTRASEMISRELDKSPAFRKIISGNSARRAAVVAKVRADLEERVAGGAKLEQALKGAVSDYAALFDGLIPVEAAEAATNPYFPSMGRGPSASRGLLQADERPTLDPRDLNKRGAIANLADSLVAYDRSKTGSQQEPDYGI